MIFFVLVILLGKEPLKLLYLSKMSNILKWYFKMCSNYFDFLKRIHIIFVLNTGFNNHPVKFIIIPIPATCRTWEKENRGSQPIKHGWSSHLILSGNSNTNQVYMCPFSCTVPTLFDNFFGFWITLDKAQIFPHLHYQIFSHVKVNMEINSFLFLKTKMREK